MHLTILTGLLQYLRGPFASLAASGGKLIRLPEVQSVVISFVCFPLLPALESIDCLSKESRPENGLSSTGHARLITPQIRTRRSVASSTAPSSSVEGSPSAFRFWRRRFVAAVPLPGSYADRTEVRECVSLRPREVSYRTYRCGCPPLTIPVHWICQSPDGRHRW